MNVLVITGDKTFGPGHERYEVQKSVVDTLAVVYWGRGSVWPNLPEEKFDVVTAQDPLLRGLFALYAAFKKEAKVNVQVHMDLESLSWWKKAIAKIVLRYADSVRVVSEKIKQQVLHIAPQAKVTVLPVFIDVERFRAVVRRDHPQKTVLWIGRYEDEKDPLLALEVFTKVLASGTEAKLVMIGRGSLQGALIERGLGKPIEVRGWEDPIPMLEVADVVLCTSKFESFGASIVEALAASVPVVAPDVGVAKEAGATIASRNKLAEAIIGILKSNEKATIKIPLLTKSEWVMKWKESLE